MKSIESLKSKFIQLMYEQSNKSIIKSKNHPRFFEELGTKIVQSVLRQEGYQIIPTSKSEYPEVKFTDGKKTYAIDIKTGRKSAAPQFDLCHVSLYPQMNYKVFEEEWVFIVKYDLNKSYDESLVECYFEKLHNVASIQKTGRLAGKVLSKGGHAIKVRPITWEKIKNRDFEITDKETFLKLVISTQESISGDPEKLKVMKEQVDKFNTHSIKTRLDLKTEEGIIQWILKHNLDIKSITDSLSIIKKQMSKKQTTKFPKKLRSIINKHDPLNLITIGCPEDEYDPEVETIFEKLKPSNTEEEVLDIVYEEFIHWFGKSAGHKDSYIEVSKDVYKWLSKKK
jgi:hypothetical protein